MTAFRYIATASFVVIAGLLSTAVRASFGPYPGLGKFTSVSSKINNKAVTPTLVSAQRFIALL